MKRTIKRITAFFCTWALICSALPLSYAAETTINLGLADNTESVTISGLYKPNGNETSSEVADMAYNWMAYRREVDGQEKQVTLLSEAEYHVEKQAGNSFHLYNTTLKGENNKIYLARSSSDNTNIPGLRYPFNTSAEAIVFEPAGSNGEYRIQVGNQNQYLLFCIKAIKWANYNYFHFGKKFDDSGERYQIDNSNYSAQGYGTDNVLSKFQLFSAKETASPSDVIYGYELVTDIDTADGKDCLVTIKLNDTYHILFPTSKAVLYTSEAEISKTQVTFTAKAIGETTVKVGGQTYNINVKSDISQPSNIVSERTNVAGQSVYLRKGQTSAAFPVGVDIQSTPDAVRWTTPGIASAQRPGTETGTKYESFVKINSGSGSEFETTIPAAQCLYTFQKNQDRTYQVSGKTSDGTIVYLHPKDYKTNGPIQFTNKIDSITIVPCTGVADSFLFSSGSDYLSFNRYNNFNGDNDPSIRNVFLYTPTAHGEKGSDEFPGYERVTNLEKLDGKQCLITLYKDGYYYLVHPSAETSSNNRIAHVAKMAKQYTPSYAEVVFTGVKAGVTTATIGNTTFRIQVVDGPVSATGAAKGYPINKLTLSCGVQYQISLPQLEQGQNWSVSPTNDTVAGIAVSGNSAVVTAKKAGAVTFAFSSGNKTHQVFVTVLDTGVTEGEKICDFFADSLDHTKAYYHIKNNNGGFNERDFHEIEQGEALYVRYSMGGTIYFYAAPDEGYVLTHMNATNSNNFYEKLDSNTTEVNRGPAGDYAMNNKSCAGTFHFTINANLGTSILSFRSVKLPEIEAKVDSIQSQSGAPKPYKEGDAVQEGDKVKFEISITVQPGITYSEVWLGNSLTDEKLRIEDILNGTKTAGRTDNGYSIYTNVQAENNTVIPELLVKVTEGPNGSKTYVFSQEYTVTEDDVGEKIQHGAALENIMSMTYRFSTTYQNSTQDIDHSSLAAAILTLQMGDRMGYMNLTLDGKTIGLNVFFADETTSGWSKTENGKDFYHVVFATSNTDNASNFIASVPYNTSGSAGYKIGDKYYHRFTVNVSHMDLDKKIYVCVQDYLGNRISSWSKEPMTVNQYANIILDDSAGAKYISEWQVNGKKTALDASKYYAALKNLVITMKNYSQCLQAFANKTTATGVAFLNTELPSLTNTYKKEVHQGAVDYTGIQLVYNDDDFSAAGLRIYTNYSPAAGDELKDAQQNVIAINENGTSFELHQDVKLVHGNERYYIEISNISPAWLSNTYQIVLTTAGDAVSTLEVSAMTYVALMLDPAGTGETIIGNDTPTQALKDLARAMYEYSEAAKAYCGSGQNLGQYLAAS